MALWDRIRLLLLFTIAWLIIVWAVDGGQPAAAVRRRGADPGRRVAVAALAGRRRAACASCTSSSASAGRATTGSGRSGCSAAPSGCAAPAVLRLDPVPARPAAQVARVRRAVRAGRRRRSWTPRRCWRCSRRRRCSGSALPLIVQLLFAFFFIAFQFIGLFWLLSRGGVDTYYPDDIKTRFTDVWGQDHVRGPGQGEHRLPGEPGRRSRPRAATCPSGPAAVGPARHRQDADGRGGGRRDRQAVRVRRPGRVHQHVHGRRHPQGQVAVPEAAQAGAALRRRDRLLRRGRRAGQPRRAGRRAARAAGARDGRRPRRSTRPAATASPTCPSDTRCAARRARR